jgi:hypothetical protein
VAGNLIKRQDVYWGVRERYSYDVANQLTNVRYNADQVWMGDAANLGRTVDYVYATDKQPRERERQRQRD